MEIYWTLFFGQKMKSVESRDLLAAIQIVQRIETSFGKVRGLYERYIPVLKGSQSDSFTPVVDLYWTLGRG